MLVSIRTKQQRGLLLNIGLEFTPPKQRSDGMNVFINLVVNRLHYRKPCPAKHKPDLPTVVIAKTR